MFSVYKRLNGKNLNTTCKERNSDKLPWKQTPGNTCKLIKFINDFIAEFINELEKYLNIKWKI